MQIVDARDYTYPVAKVERVTDGDTYVLVLDLGFRMSATLPIRLYPWDCPELHAAAASPFEKREAKRAASFAQTWFDFLPPTAQLWVTTHKDEQTFGRWLGDLFFTEQGKTEQQHLGLALQGSGLATPWPTRWHEVFDPDRHRQ